MPKILNEKLDNETPLNYIAESLDSPRKGYLGRLEGVCADFGKPTRNGRRYPRELWESVLQNDEFLEGLHTKTLFGETDHPDNRLETSIKEVAVVLTKLYIDENDQTLKGSFDILDTPNGRILKSLADYGSQLGVSSRGAGDIVESAGETIIDPSSYNFVTFDVVILPAVKKARPTVTESLSVSDSKPIKLVESFKKEIDSAKSSNDLESIRNLINGINMPELDSLKESINIKLNDLSERETISSKLLSDLEESSKAIDDLKKDNSELLEKLSAGTTRETDLNSQVSKLRSLTTKISKSLLESKKLNKSNYSKIDKLNDKINELSKINSLNESKIKSMITKITDLKENLTKSNKLSDTYKSRLNSSRINSRSLNESVINYKSDLSDYKSKYNDMKSLYEDTAKNLEISNSDIDSYVSEIRSLKKSKHELLESIKSLKLSYEMHENDLNNEIINLTSQIETLNEQVDSLSTKFSNANESLNKSKLANNKLTEGTNRNISKLSKELELTKKKLSESMSSLNSSNRMYLSLKSRQSGVSEDSVLSHLPNNFSTSDIDRVVDELSDRSIRFSQLPIRVDPESISKSSPARVVITESESVTSPEDSKTKSFLESTMSKLSHKNK